MVIHLFLYASDVVQQAIVCIVDEMKKLQLVHERTIGSDLTTVDNFLQPVLDNPNPIMTQSEFIEKFMWLLLLNYNSFIFPVWESETTLAIKTKNSYFS